VTWTYSGNPSASSLDAVRFYIQDTDTSDQLFSDAELNFLLTSYTNPLAAAMQACRTLVAKYARAVDSSVDRVSESASQRMKQYSELATQLERRLGSLALPVMGGRKYSEKDTLESDTDAIQPAIRRGQFDFPGSSGL